MSNPADVGISPVLLQAITQTLSNKATQQHRKQQQQEQVAWQEPTHEVSIIQQDETPVPISEQVIVSQIEDDGTVRIEKEDGGETIVVLQDVDNQLHLKTEKLDDDDQDQQSVEHIVMENASILQNTPQNVTVANNEIKTIHVELPGSTHQIQIPQQGASEFQMGSVLSAIASHLAKNSKSSSEEQILNVPQLRQIQQIGGGGGNSQIVVSVPQQQVQIVPSPARDITVSDTENVITEQIVHSIPSTPSILKNPAKRAKTELVEGQSNNAVYIRADSLPPGTVLQTIETDNGIFTIAQVSTVNTTASPSCTTASTEMYGPCPICGDRISGYHYGIYSCESCKGFFKRTVQNKKTFMCHRKGECEVNIGNRKKCPACRFKRCLIAGMKLEAIRVDRTRGGRSSYEGCTPSPRLNIPTSVSRSPATPVTSAPKRRKLLIPGIQPPGGAGGDAGEQVMVINSARSEDETIGGEGDGNQVLPQTPQVLEDLLAVESLMTEEEGEQSCCEGKLRDGDTELFASLLHIADHCLYKIVRWARNLPDFANVSTDDQILLLQNCWAELLMACVAWNSMRGQNELVLSHGRRMNAELGKALGFEEVTQRMIDMAEVMKNLEVDTYEFVALKVLILMSPDVKGLKNSDVIRDYQDRIAESLLVYSITHFPQQLNKHAELIARLPELARTCNLAKELLTARQNAGEVPQYSLLSELLKGDIVVQQSTSSE